VRIIKFLLFISIIIASIISIFPEINMKFVMFHLLVCFIILFPYYFWIYSIKTAIFTVVLVFLVAIGILVITSKTDFSKKEIKISSDINLSPRMTRIEFNFHNNNLIYDFSTQSLKKVSETGVSPSDTPGIIKTYYNHVNSFIKDIDFNAFNLNKIKFLKYVLWVLYLVLFAFAFSYKPSVVVSYSIVFFTLPYALYLGSLIFFKDFNNIYFSILKTVILLLLLTIGLIRAKT